jgi:hypothetical protein
MRAEKEAVIRRWPLITDSFPELNSTLSIARSRNPQAAGEIATAWPHRVPVR